MEFDFDGWNLIIYNFFDQAKMADEQLFDPKQINQSYTIAIIKPNIVL